MTDTPIRVAHRLLAPRVAYLVGTNDTENGSNLIPVSNLTSVSTDPQHIALAVHKSLQTHRNLAKGMGFTVSVPEYDQLEGVWVLGSKYSHFPANSNTEKLLASRLDLDETVSDYGPVVPSAIGWLSCRTISRIDLSGDHGIFVGEVEDVWFNPAILDPDGTPKSSVRPVMQQTGNLFTTASETATRLAFFDDEDGK